MPVSPQNDVIALLKWQFDAGCDAAVAESGVNKLLALALSAPTAPVAVATPAKGPVSDPARAKVSSERVRVPMAPPVGAATAVQSARELAAGADTLDALKAAFQAFDGCAIKQTARNFVFSDGNPSAPLIILGEAPGREEDRQGLPFVGRSGKLLDDMLAAIGLSREADAYISNILPWRPPGDRTPTDGEIASCLPFALRHIALAAPRAVLLLGGTAAKSLLIRKEGITRLRGRWTEIVPGDHGVADQAPIPALPTFHPAYLLRTPAQKRQAWRDLILVKAVISNKNTGP